MGIRDSRTQGVLIMPFGDIETYFADKTWKNRIEGTMSVSGTYEFKEEAVAPGRQMAQEREVEHIIRKQDGTIGERNSYGYDPREIHG